MLLCAEVEGLDGVGIEDLKGDLETRLLFLRCL
jgi:hypothetical protein